MHTIRLTHCSVLRSLVAHIISQSSPASYSSIFHTIPLNNYKSLSPHQNLQTARTKWDTISECSDFIFGTKPLWEKGCISFTHISSLLCSRESFSRLASIFFRHSLASLRAGRSRGKSTTVWWSNLTSLCCLYYIWLAWSIPVALSHHERICTACCVCHRWYSMEQKLT